MRQVSRRDFMKLGAKLGALIGVSPALAPQIADSLESLAKGAPPVLWLQGQSCSGCSVSFLNTDSPGAVEILTQYISLCFHSTLSTATGKTGMDIVERVIEKGDFFLVVEGSIPEKMPHACVMGGKPITEWVSAAAKQSSAVISIGTCASFGGIPAAENNPTGATSVPDFLSNQNISTPIIRLPGCPCHPDWLVGTLAHVLSFGLPDMDSLQRPTMFYGKVLHEQCPRFADYERENFAKTFGEEGCLFNLGCAGPNTYADCTLRHWNSGVNTCIKAGAPCVGCASEFFAKKASFPLYTKNGLGITKA